MERGGEGKEKGRGKKRERQVKASLLFFLLHSFLHGTPLSKDLYEHTLLWYLCGDPSFSCLQTPFLGDALGLVCFPRSHHRACDLSSNTGVKGEGSCEQRGREGGRKRMWKSQGLL